MMIVTKKYSYLTGGSPTVGNINILSIELTWKFYFKMELNSITYYLSYYVLATMSLYIWIDASRIISNGGGEHEETPELT